MFCIRNGSELGRENSVSPSQTLKYMNYKMNFMLFVVIFFLLSDFALCPFSSRDCIHCADITEAIYTDKCCCSKARLMSMEILTHLGHGYLRCCFKKSICHLEKALWDKASLSYQNTNIFRYWQKYLQTCLLTAYISDDSEWYIYKPETGK